MKKILLLILGTIILSSCDGLPPKPDIYSQNTGDVELKCPWTCGEPTRIDKYYINENLCTNIEDFISELDNTYADNVYTNSGSTSYNDVAYHGLHNYDNLKITTGIGWTGWWVGLSKYCINKGYWEKSNENSIKYGDTTKLVIKLKGEKKYKGDIKGKKDYDYISIEGKNNGTKGKQFTSPSFNSPFIYFKNFNDGNLSVSVNSEFNNYKSVPEFTSKNTWNGILKNDKIVINNEVKDNLFYELDLKKVELSRKGRNFSDKNELIEYLKNGDFFNKLGFTEEQKNNSLNYLLPKLEKSPNYYLTLLSDNSVNNISQLNFSEKPDELIRRFFAVYPTKNKIKTSGDIEFSKIEIDKNKGTVIETGEVLVNSNILVFWKK